MDPTFGTRLRLQREEHQIPLATIAEQTKIKLSLLEGLERDDVSRWPTGLFRRSYFRAYAAAIGLDPDRSLREFQPLYPAPEGEADITQALAQARGVNGNARRPPTRLRFLIDSAVSALPVLHLQPSSKSPAIPTPRAAPSEESVAVHPKPVLAPPVGARPVDTTPLDAFCVEAGAGEAIPVGAIDVEAIPVDAIPRETRAAVRETAPDVNFAALAELCTRLARATEVCDVAPVLEEFAHALRAVGLVVWVGDPLGCELMPVFASGY